MTVNMSSAPKAAWQALGFCKRQSALRQIFGCSTLSLDVLVDLTGVGCLMILSKVLASDGGFAGLLLTLVLGSRISQGSSLRG